MSSLISMDEFALDSEITESVESSGFLFDTPGIDEPNFKDDWLEESEEEPAGKAQTYEWAENIENFYPEHTVFAQHLFWEGQQPNPSSSSSSVDDELDPDVSPEKLSAAEPQEHEQEMLVDQTDFLPSFATSDVHKGLTPGNEVDRSVFVTNLPISSENQPCWSGQQPDKNWSLHSSVASGHVVHHHHQEMQFINQCVPSLPFPNSLLSADQRCLTTERDQQKALRNQRDLSFSLEEDIRQTSFGLYSNFELEQRIAERISPNCLTSSSSSSSSMQERPLENFPLDRLQGSYPTLRPSEQCQSDSYSMKKSPSIVSGQVLQSNSHPFIPVVSTALTKLGFKRFEGDRKDNPSAEEANAYYDRNMLSLMEFVSPTMHYEICKAVNSTYKDLNNLGKNKDRSIWNFLVEPILTKFNSMKLYRLAYNYRRNGLTPHIVRGFYSFLLYLDEFCPEEERTLLLEACDVAIEVATEDPYLEQFPLI
eukprot:TRINITY_DN5776_c0_g2_i4.p1 TRINITY_DN5776_c0_g2~~TRINITY_DN5776_c0_g2_i4.p1  ORF type:complete len:480 (-),score=96.87 TRINITY_DN5776_c0_g2_i4:603-2042(-)